MGTEGTCEPGKMTRESLIRETVYDPPSELHFIVLAVDGQTAWTTVVHLQVNGIDADEGRPFEGVTVAFTSNESAKKFIEDTRVAHGTLTVFRHFEQYEWPRLPGLKRPPEAEYCVIDPNWIHESVWSSDHCVYTLPFKAESQ